MRPLALNASSPSDVAGYVNTSRDAAGGKSGIGESLPPAPPAAPAPELETELWAASLGSESAPLQPIGSESRVARRSQASQRVRRRRTASKRRRSSSVIRERPR